MNDPKAVYIIFGECGEYSDHRMWVIRAFLDEGHADAYLRELEIEAAMTRASYKGSSKIPNKNQFLSLDDEMDHETLCWYTEDLKYYIQEVPLGHKLLGLDAQALLAAARTPEEEVE